MNIVSLHSQKNRRPPELNNLFNRMETAITSANADIDKSIRLVKTLAPLLCDQSSNARHIETIVQSPSLQEKVIAILMLGFPKNRAALPTLQEVLHTGTKSMRMASALAISQMRDGENNPLLYEVLNNSYRQERSVEVKNALRQAMASVHSKHHAHLENH